MSTNLEQSGKNIIEDAPETSLSNSNDELKPGLYWVKTQQWGYHVIAYWDGENWQVTENINGDTGVNPNSAVASGSAWEYPLSKRCSCISLGHFEERPRDLATRYAFPSRYVAGRPYNLEHYRGEWQASPGKRRGCFLSKSAIGATILKPK